MMFDGSARAGASEPRPEHRQGLGPFVRRDREIALGAGAPSCSARTGSCDEAVPCALQGTERPREPTYRPQPVAQIGAMQRGLSCVWILAW